MKIRCEFCDSMFDDTEEQCPNCGAPNQNVRRSSGDQPLTIAQLQEWYHRKGLPPYETTRFFIGQNYTGPKAFGIYFDENTGNYVVYKNKASGSRSVRYEGTDEAYAVNELFQRLKQEITQQKMHNVRDQQADKNFSSSKKASAFGCGSTILQAFLTIILVPVLILGGVFSFFFVQSLNIPSEGYYNYDDTCYYYSSTDYLGLNWFYYDTAEPGWLGPLQESEVPNKLETKSRAKRYYLQETWNSSLACTNFSESVYAKDLSVGFTTQIGYYSVDGNCYYHMSDDFDYNWFQYSSEWKNVAFTDLPEALRHPSTAPDCFQSEAYDVSLGTADFSQTLLYRDYHAPSTISTGYYQVDNRVFYHLKDWYDDGWYLYQDDDWQFIESSALPEQLQHPSTVEDFYFTPTWDSSTQFSDFEDTEMYKDTQDRSDDSWDNDDDDDWDWGSNDSWDFGDTDWDSDW